LVWTESFGRDWLEVRFGGVVGRGVVELVLAAVAEILCGRVA
jgi:hypothetical protein